MGSWEVGSWEDLLSHGKIIHIYFVLSSLIRIFVVSKQ